MYLPCWYDGLTWQEQFDCYWISEGTSPYNREENPPTYLSLLPIRFYNRPTFCNSVKLKYYERSCRSADRECDDCRTIRILHSRDAFAVQLWKRAAEIVAEEFPLIEQIQFGPQQFSGVYPITFPYSVAQVAARQEAVMRRMIEDGFSVEECVTLRCEEVPNGKRWIYEGVLGLPDDEFENLFSDLPFGELPPIGLNRQVCYSYDQCENYYKTFDERLLTLGNQYRNYGRSDPTLESAIERWSFKEIKVNETNGQRLNEITKLGESVFSIVTTFCMDTENLNDAGLAFLDACVAMGANPAVYGITGKSPLAAAAEWNEHRLTEWLLKQGVNPNIHPFLDDYYDAEGTLLDWIEHLYDDAYGDEALRKATKKTMDLLEQYGAKRMKMFD